MRSGSIFALVVGLLWCSLAGLLVCFPAAAHAQEIVVSDASVLRARNELNRVESMVSGGVLPRARLADAQDALADAEDDFAIRTALSKRDISVEEAESAVLLTQKRVDRRQKALDARRQLVDAGILARNEMGEYESALNQASSQRTWAVERVKLARDIADLARTEQALMRQIEAGAPVPGLVEHFTGSNRFNLTEFPSIEQAFEKRFAHPLPVSAMGESGVHKSLGFDHRNRIDVALVPEQPEGLWLRTYLKAHSIPFFAFRSAVTHQATGAHIHIGPPSDHYSAQAGTRSRTQPRLINGTD